MNGTGEPVEISSQSRLAGNHDMTENNHSESESESYESESPDEESRRVSLAWAENKVNAIKEIMRNFEGRGEDYERPDEYENEAVSMAIKQHGLRNKEPEINQNHCKDDSSEATTSNDIIEDNVCLMSKEIELCCNSDIQNLAYKQNMKLNGDFDDDDDFLTEAVAVAISEKGLSSSSCKPLE